MSILLQNTSLLTWLWHDATWHSLYASSVSDGELSVALQCEINPFEDRQPLFDLGIRSSVVTVQFCEVRRIDTRIHGDYSPRPAIDRWDILDASLLLDQINAQGPSVNRLTHHRITTSSGSTLDIVCEAVWLDGDNAS
jgi:hypothetical protein